MPSDDTRSTPPETNSDTNTESRLGDRGDASGRNLAQNREIGQDDPMDGSRQGREANKPAGYPGIPDIGTDAAQNEEAERKD
ncbi:conserved hypothetical protein [Burkholderiales bacterium 8X]|nr:conserved hypothetical protein [Burkholderiales bacterium 8X]